MDTSQTNYSVFSCIFYMINGYNTIVGYFTFIMEHIVVGFFEMDDNPIHYPLLPPRLQGGVLHAVILGHAGQEDLLHARKLPGLRGAAPFGS